MTTKTKNNSSQVLSEIKKLYRFMQTNELNTLDYSKGVTHIRLVRKVRQQTVPVITTQHTHPRHMEQTPRETAAYEGESLKSPLMGIFYRGPSPSSPPFIREGESVKEGQVLCLIESMKVFNEVKADYSCVIEKVLVENGKPVKSGQSLFAVKKT